jgi:predicted ATP-dependent serine protease
MMAYAASILTGKESYYMAAEEPLEQIKGRSDRLGFTDDDKFIGEGRIRMIPLMGGYGDLPDPTKSGLTIYDSLNAASGDDMRGAVMIARSLKEYSEKGRTPVIAVSHINKRGDIAGLEALQHWVDTTMTFFPTEEKLGEESPRELVVEKNRNGAAFKKMLFNMTEKGLVPIGEEE